MIRMKTCALAALALAGFALALAHGGEEAKPEKKPEVKKPEAKKSEEKKASKKPTNFEKAVADCQSGEIPYSPSKANGLEAYKGWKAARWGDLALCRQFEIKKAKRTLIYLATGGGKKGKAVAELGTRLLLAEEGKIKLAVYNRSNVPAKVAIALSLGRKFKYYETPARSVEANKWAELSFDLAAKDYKTQTSKWKYSAALGEERFLSRVAILLYHNNKLCRVLIDGVKIDTKPLPKRKPPEKKEEPRKKPEEKKPAEKPEEKEEAKKG